MSGKTGISYISRIEYEDRVKQQEGKCLICGTDPKTKGPNGKLFVDHCHATMKIRGLLCNTCNSGLGMFRDQIALLNNAIQYLEVNGDHYNKKIKHKVPTKTQKITKLAAEETHHQTLHRKHNQDYRERNANDPAWQEARQAARQKYWENNKELINQRRRDRAAARRAAYQLQVEKPQT